MKKPVNQFSSICFPQSGEKFSSPADICPETRSALLEKYHAELEKCSPRETWAGDAHQKSVPYPVLGNEAHQRQLAELSEALVLAITDIVERWWSDEKACFPERMPLEPVEERLLQWMENLDGRVLRPFKSCQGSWRPDFLLESSDDPEQIENYRICEINARFCWNGFLFTAFGQQALLNMGIEQYGIKGATDPQKVIAGLNGLFDSSLPLHLVKGEEYGYDIHMLVPYAQRYLGVDVKIIPPESLRLVPATAPGGYKLYCLSSADSKQPTILNDAGESLEEVHQLGVELHQRELLAMSFEMLQQISLRCFNDLRTVLLVHDKRMLGLVLEELDLLVARNVLSSHQAGILDRGLVHTIIPGSDKLKHFVSGCRADASTKDKYLLKPVRSGKGAGILFGDQVTQEEWMSLLQGMQDPHLKHGKTTYVVQKQIQQLTYDVLLDEEAGVGNFPLIGTFHITHGTFLGLGLWRSGPGRICALSRGGAWMCSVIQQ
ncbi:hypothetical protein N7457_008577 [Penicillium paradoxum]|uniref:uncharacterized protein n=1 Tax=Penicillium paradoxum TaxID=176176 RepID=UPI002546ED5C|nr:uncharacterized protein N7457_008577 [Penicillium paradoxum]KAJ5773681.1 hypothetical protein N7457_008577 [Penicillium paradoxum]